MAIDDEFDLSSGDEADMLALVDGVGIKRRASLGHEPPPKRLAIELQRFPSALDTLTKNFGMKEFRSKQEQVISRILSGGSAVVVFPTGGGKSLCYQVPALAFQEEDKLSKLRLPNEGGITLVVSPLIALMKDQVDALLRKGIRAATFDSSKTREEYLATCETLDKGELRLLYCAPERLNNEGFIAQMKYVPGGIRLLAVDEAHCISEWGHAFRPDYLSMAPLSWSLHANNSEIARFANEIFAERVVCLTATATPRVAADICRAFDIDETAGLFRTSTYRPNLQLLAESGKTKKELYPRLYKFLKDNPGPSIVYVTLQKQTEQLASELKKKGFNARAFHAGMDTSVKTDLQEDFLSSNDLIIVATIAFGMGIDKADIRNVVHFNIPSSLESYSQEIGRAGRDGKPSKCMFYVCGEDLHLREMFARGDLPSKASVKDLLNEIFSMEHTRQPVGSELRFSHYSQERDYDIRSTTLKNIYAQLELTYGLLRESTPIYSKYSFRASKQYDEELSADDSEAASAIFKFAKRASSLYHIDIDDVCVRLGIARGSLIHKLNELNVNRIIELKPTGVLSVYKVMKGLPKTEAGINKLANSIYTTMEKREEEALERTNEMLRLITSTACFARSLAQHFGDTLPNEETECDHCTWCLTHEAVVQELPPPVAFDWSKLKEVCTTVDVYDDARLLAKFAFGIRSPRMTILRLPATHRLFGCMEDHAFGDLLRAFTNECSKHNQQS